MKLRTPLQVQLHLTLAMETGYLTGEKPITATLVESVLSRQLDDLEPTLTRHGYWLKDMVEQFDAKPAEISALFNNQLDPCPHGRTTLQNADGRSANMTMLICSYCEPGGMDCEPIVT